MVKRVAEGTGSNITAYVIEDSLKKYENLFNVIKPAVNITFIMVEGWDKLPNILHTKENDKNELFIYIKPRRDTPGWHQELNRRSIVAPLSENNMIIAYPATEEKVDDMKFLRIG
jgi:hypothetical protein